MRITTVLRCTRLGELLWSGRGGNEVNREVKSGCVARKEPVHSTGLLRMAHGASDDYSPSPSEVEGSR